MSTRRGHSAPDVKLDATSAAQRAGMLEPFSVETSSLVWMAIHGSICLALRHPAYTGPSRELVVAFVLELGNQLVEHGVLTKAELELVYRVEREESARKKG